jgi:outer membrane receptor protein involved in Fe transport
VGYVLPKLGDLQQDYIPGTGGFETKVQAYSATIRAKLGGVDVTSVTGFNANNYFTTTDFSYLYGSYTESVFGVAGSPISASTEGANKFTQELRLSSTIASTVDWLVGGFYTHENSPFPSTIYAENPSTGANVGLFGTFNLQSTFEEYAAFTDFTFHFTDRFDIQVGGRESEIRQTYQDTDTAYAASVFDGTTYPAPYIGPEGRSKVNAFTYLLTPQFKLTPDVMTYIRLASGYRAGGPNVGAGIPTQYEPDKTYNYELGVKGDVLDHRLSFDASVYYIDWKNIQVELIDQQTGLFFTGNAAEAKSQGVELSAEMRPFKGLRIASWVAFSDAELSKAFPVTAVDAGTYGASGDRLPYATRISGHASLDDEFPLINTITGSVGGELNYTGNRLGNFQGVDTTGAPLPRQELPGYAQVNLRAGAKYESWSTNLFVNNVIDKRGVLDGGIGTNIPYAFLYIQPRTIGLNVVKTF